MAHVIIHHALRSFQFGLRLGDGEAAHRWDGVMFEHAESGDHPFSVTGWREGVNPLDMSRSLQGGYKFVKNFTESRKLGRGVRVGGQPLPPSLPFPPSPFVPAELSHNFTVSCAGLAIAADWQIVGLRRGLATCQANRHAGLGEICKALDVLRGRDKPLIYIDIYIRPKRGTISIAVNYH